MSDDRDAGIDPRFDPAFQRGFDPASSPVQENAPEPAPRPVTTAKAAPVAAAPAPLAEPRPAPTPTNSPPPVVGTLTEDAPGVAPDLESDAPVADPDSDAGPSRNPFLLLLGVISVVLVVAGVWLFVRSGDAFNSKEVRSQGDYMSLDATIHMAPFIALLGGATAIGVLFVFAARWRRHR